MTENQTKPTDGDVPAFVDSIADSGKRSDTCELISLFQELSGQPAVLWGPSIIGFGKLHYIYESGREGDMPMVSFSPRKAALVLYGVTGFPRAPDLMAELGKFTTGKGCLYIKKLADINIDALRSLIEGALAAKGHNN